MTIESMPDSDAIFDREPIPEFVHGSPSTPKIYPSFCSLLFDPVIRCDSRFPSSKNPVPRLIAAILDNNSLVTTKKRITGKGLAMCHGRCFGPFFRVVAVHPRKEDPNGG
jgi:hypothetical protein